MTATLLILLYVIVAWIMAGLVLLFRLVRRLLDVAETLEGSEPTDVAEAQQSDFDIRRDFFVPTGVDPS